VPLHSIFFVPAGGAKQIFVFKICIQRNPAVCRLLRNKATACIKRGMFVAQHYAASGFQVSALLGIGYAAKTLQKRNILHQISFAILKQYYYTINNK
jgi:hypothetical protein